MDNKDEYYLDGEISLEDLEFMDETFDNIVKNHLEQLNQIKKIQKKPSFNSAIINDEHEEF